MLKAARYVLPILFLLFAFVSASSADELDNVQKNLDQKNKEYSNTQSSLTNIKKQISSLSSSIPSTQAEVDEANKKVEAIRGDLAKVETDLAKKRDELQTAINIRDQQIRFLYIHPGDSALELFIASDGFEDFNQLLGLQKKILGTTKDLVTSINEEVAEVKKTRDEIAQAKADLEQIASSLSTQLANMKKNLSGANYRQQSLNSSLELIKSDITRTLIRKAELDEQRRAGNLAGDPPVPISTGPSGTTYYYFYGIGRDYYMGHGTGMSQWGAKGYAQKGWSAAAILQKYYTGVSITGYGQPSTIRVVGSCYGGGGDRVLDFNTYLKGISELLSSWEADAGLMELMKAQVIAARTYAIRAVNAKGYIYGDTRDQCWTGNTSRPNWNQAVDQTNSAVVTYGGALTSTLYSASHGGHSENNENVFQGWTGNGYQGWPVAYLRGVSDMDSWPEGRGPYDQFGWNTKYSYTIGQIREILRYQGLTGTENAWIDSRVGTLTGLGIERGVSGRVAWVVLYGTSGSAKIPGKVFKSSFNSCPAAGCGAAVNGDDVMYSVNFSIGNQVR